MDQFSIKDLERLSGINAHTIRIWERRYGLMEPTRTTTNRRVYSGEDLRRIISIGVLNRSGLKVSKIARLTNEELDRLVSEQLDSSSQATDETERLLVAMLEVDALSAKKILRDSIDARGLEATVEELIFPFIRRVGDLWQTGTINPGHEHFISNIFRNQIIMALESSLPFPEEDSPSAILFLPENEMHELPLLLYDYVFRKAGYETIYLGQMTPVESVISLAEKRKPGFVVTGVSTALPPKPLKFIRSLSKALPFCRIIVAGNLASLKSLAALSNVTAVTSVDKLRKVLVKAAKG